MTMSHTPFQKMQPTVESLIEEVSDLRKLNLEMRKFIQSKLDACHSESRNQISMIGALRSNVRYLNDMLNELKKRLDQIELQGSLDWAAMNGFTKSDISKIVPMTVTELNTMIKKLVGENHGN